MIDSYLYLLSNGNLERLQPSLTYGDAHPEALKAWDAIQPRELRDALVIHFLGNYQVMWGKYENWLGYLQYVSESNREEALHKVVELRLKADKGVPTWLYEACAAAQFHGWKIPAIWVERLEAALKLSDVMAAYAPTKARKWLAEYRQSSSATT